MNIPLHPGSFPEVLSGGNPLPTFFFFFYQKPELNLLHSPVVKTQVPYQGSPLTQGLLSPRGSPHLGAPLNQHSPTPGLERAATTTTLDSRRLKAKFLEHLTTRIVDYNVGL